MKRKKQGPNVGEHHEGEFGVYMQHKIQKLRQQNDKYVANKSASASSQQLFQNVAIYVNGYTTPSKDELRELILTHGGGFEHYQTAKVTHIVATHLPLSKIRELKSMKNKIPVVQPEWIVQSIKEKRLLPIHPFLFKGLLDSSQQSINFEPTKSNVEKEVDDKQAAKMTTARVPPAPNENLPKSSLSREVKSTKDGPEFVRSFFAKSRLHHIGSWRSSLEQRASTGRESLNQDNGSIDGKNFVPKVVLHVDMDCFFVSVSIRDKPHLKSMPVAVAHSAKGGSSEISSCNYEARSKGLHAGMFMSQAKKLCPNLIVLPYDFESIEQVTEDIYTIFYKFANAVQPLSCDEALLGFGEGVDGISLAHLIREEILQATKCPASVGISYNILLARLATRRAKPNGIYKLDIDEVPVFLSKLPVKNLPGVGYRTSKKLKDLKVLTCGDLLTMPVQKLTSLVGPKTGKLLINYAKGIDDRPLVPSIDRKSVSAEISYGVRFDHADEVDIFMYELSKEVVLRLNKISCGASNLQLKIKKRKQNAKEPAKYLGHGACDNLNRSVGLPAPTAEVKVIHNTCMSLLNQLPLSPVDIRGVGIQASKLVSLSSTNISSYALDGWLAGSTLQKESQRILENGKSITEKSTDLSIQAPPKIPIDELITYSQIDPEVFYSLPNRLQVEVNAYCKQQAKLKPFGRTKDVSAQKKGKKEIVRLNYSACIKKLPIAQRNNEVVNEGNTYSFSQLDLDVFNSLPLSVQLDIKKSCLSRKAAQSLEHNKASNGENMNEQVAIDTSARITWPIFSDTIDMWIQNDIDLDQSHLQCILKSVLQYVMNLQLDIVLKMMRCFRRKLGMRKVSKKWPIFFNSVLTQVNDQLKVQYQGQLSASIVDYIVI